ncbi:MAG: hypothetical protein V3R55_00995, partial [Alphaproteobacteria bacterium]
MSGHLSIDWAPLIPWPLLAALAAAALIVIALALWCRAPGVWWRALSAATLLIALANPSLIEQDRQLLSDVALVVVDRSPSQSIGTRTAQTDSAVAGLLERLEGLSDTEVRVIEASADAFAAEQEGTRLFSEVRRALASLPRQRVSGLILVSDGQIHDVPENLESLGLDVPVHLLLSGGQD